jgi:hypothetical protein
MRILQERLSLSSSLPRAECRSRSHALPHPTTPVARENRHGYADDEPNFVFPRTEMPFRGLVSCLSAGQRSSSGRNGWR